MKFSSGIADEASVFDLDCPTGDFEDCKQNWNYETLPEVCKSFLIISSENLVKVLIHSKLFSYIFNIYYLESTQFLRKGAEKVDYATKIGLMSCGHLA